MTFIVIALLLCVLAAAFVLAPWWRRAEQEPDRRSALAGVVRERLAELERDRATGAIDDATWAQLTHEQERQLLAEVMPASPPQRRRSGRLIMLLIPALAVPLLGLALYARLGGLADWQLQALLEQAQSEMAAERDNSATLVALREALAKRLIQVDDKDGRRRVLLARLELEMGNLPGAAEQYRALYRQFPEDAAAAAQLAQALYLANGRRMTAEIEGLASAAVQLQPDQSMALGLLGIGAFERGDYPAAIDHWRRLLALLPATSPERQIIARGVAEAQRRSGVEIPGPALEVEVTLSGALAEQLPAGAVLFVFARAENGPPMPLAAARLQPSAWPVAVRLDETSAMAPGISLAGAGQLEVVARISRSGDPQPTAGDLEGRAAGITLGDGPVAVPVTIDRRL